MTPAVVGLRTPPVVVHEDLGTTTSSTWVLTPILNRWLEVHGAALGRRDAVCVLTQGPLH